MTSQHDKPNRWRPRWITLAAILMTVTGLGLGVIAPLILQEFATNEFFFEILSCLIAGGSCFGILIVIVMLILQPK